MKRSKTYYVVRDVVRLVFWLGLIFGGLYLFQLFCIGLWALQF